MRSHKLAEALMKLPDMEVGIAWDCGVRGDADGAVIGEGGDFELCDELGRRRPDEPVLTFGDAGAMIGIKKVVNFVTGTVEEYKE